MQILCFFFFLFNGSSKCGFSTLLSCSGFIICSLLYLIYIVFWTNEDDDDDDDFGQGHECENAEIVFQLQLRHTWSDLIWVKITMFQLRYASNCRFSCYWPFNTHIKTAQQLSNGPLYCNTVIGTLAVDGWAVTFATARRGLGGWSLAQSPYRCTKCNSPPINGQCTNFILFDVAL